MTLLQSGNRETFKGCYHGALGVFAAGALVYNLAAFSVRKERHLALNVLLYGALVALESRKTAHHMDGAA